MRADSRSRDQRNKARRGATPARSPRQPLSLAPLLEPVRAVAALPWRGVGIAVLIPLLLVALVQGVMLALNHFDRNVGVIEISGDLRNLTRETLYGELAYLMDESFFAVDLEEAQARIEKLPWVESSRVQRAWPNRLHFWVKEHQPIALWGDTELLSRHGEVFEPADRSNYAHLPRLQGPQGSQESIWMKYVRWSQELGALDMKISAISQAPRGAWEVELHNGILIKLGREDLQGKMDRLQQIVRAQLRDRMPDIEVLDARYANGLAVRWKEHANNG